MKRILIAVILCGMLLISCGSGIVQTRIIKQTIPPLPEKPQYYSVPFDENLCLNEQGARNMLKNKALLDDYAKQLEAIIESLR